MTWKIILTSCSRNRLGILFAIILTSVNRLYFSKYFEYKLAFEVSTLCLILALSPQQTTLTLIIIRTS